MTCTCSASWYGGKPRLITYVQAEVYVQIPWENECSVSDPRTTKKTHVSLPCYVGMTMTMTSLVKQY